MTSEELKKKYGSTTVMGVDKSLIDHLPARGMIPLRGNPKLIDLVGLIGRSLFPRLRCEAELNPDFKQIIPYVLLRHRDTGDIFTTTRLGGDSRLQGMLSIGLGGHMDEGENVISCLLRELEEEVGLTDKDIVSLTLYGYLFNDDSEVDSVHLGIVYILDTHRRNVRC